MESPTDQHAAWVNFCSKTVVDPEPDGFFNELATGDINSNKKFLNAILENPKRNFILIPSKDKGYPWCLHHCSAC